VNMRRATNTVGSGPSDGVDGMAAVFMGEVE
jgi:hypothetical protein